MKTALLTCAEFQLFKYVTDVVKDIIHRSAAMYRGRMIYAVSKKQCNKKEIRFILNQLSKN